MDSSSSSWTDASSDYDEELAIEAKRALAYLHTHRKYRYIEFLAQGGYGWVALVRDDENCRSLAVKCTSETSEMELSWWPRLHHSNILPLLECITLDNCTVFVMPAMRKDLWTLVTEPRFYDQELSFGLCRIWLRDVATALAYLHGQFLCHLDLKLDNVFMKEDGYCCLGDFSLLSDIRQVPSGVNFLEIYEPPEYTEWCHTTPPEAIASSTMFGGDKADMWQFGILAIDLLTNLKLTDDKSTGHTLFHHDVWPFLQKVLLHEEYLSCLLEETFSNVLFQKDDFALCSQFLSSILKLEPDTRISAEDARRHGLLDIEWPQLPMEFTLPERVVEHLPEPKPLPIEEIEDPSLTVEEVLAAAEAKTEEDGLSKTPSIGALDVMKRKVKKMQKEKVIRRESIAVEAGKNPLGIKRVPPVKKEFRKPTKSPKPGTSSKRDDSSSSDDDETDGTKKRKTGAGASSGGKKTPEAAPKKTTSSQSKKRKVAVKKPEKGSK